MCMNLCKHTQGATVHHRPWRTLHHTHTHSAPHLHSQCNTHIHTLTVHHTHTYTHSQCTTLAFIANYWQDITPRKGLLPFRLLCCASSSIKVRGLRSTMAKTHNAPLQSTGYITPRKGLLPLRLLCCESSSIEVRGLRSTTAGTECATTALSASDERVFGRGGSAVAWGERVRVGGECAEWVRARLGVGEESTSQIRYILLTGELAVASLSRTYLFQPKPSLLDAWIGVCVCLFQCVFCVCVFGKLWGATQGRRQRQLSWWSVGMMSIVGSGRSDFYGFAL